MRNLLRSNGTLLRACVHLVAAAAFVASARAQQITVYLDFSDTPGISQTQRDAIQACVQGKYAGITSSLTFTQNQPVGGLVKTIKYSTDVVQTVGLWGNSHKDTNNAEGNTGLSAAALAVFDTEAKRTNAYCETTAHELGHLLCAVHNMDNPPSLMTQGTKVPWTTRAADGRQFTSADQQNLAMGIAMTQAGLSWKLQAAYDAGDLIAVQGVITGQWEPDDTVIDVDVTLSNNSSFDFGWITSSGTFAKMVPAGHPSATVLAYGGGVFDFAVRGAVGSPWAGQVFEMGTFGSVQQLLDPRSPSQSVFPPQTQRYWGTAQLRFDLAAVGAPPVLATVSMQPMSPNHGWVVAPTPASVPALPPWGAWILALALVAAFALVAARRRARPRADR